MEYLPSEAETGQATTNASLGASAAIDENMVAVLEDFNLAAGPLQKVPLATQTIAEAKMEVHQLIDDAMEWLQLQPRRMPKLPQRGRASDSYRLLDPAGSEDIHRAQGSTRQLP